jgi:hypothetical protein
MRDGFTDVSRGTRTRTRPDQAKSGHGGPSGFCMMVMQAIFGRVSRAVPTARRGENMASEVGGRAFPPEGWGHHDDARREWLGAPWRCAQIRSHPPAPMKGTWRGAWDGGRLPGHYQPPFPRAFRRRGHERWDHSSSRGNLVIDGARPARSLSPLAALLADEKDPKKTSGVVDHSRGSPHGRRPRRLARADLSAAAGTARDSLQ